MSSALVDKRPMRLSGKGRIDFLVPRWPLMAGNYHVSFYVGSAHGVQDCLSDATIIQVIDGDFYGTGKLHHEGWQGKAVLVRHSWTLHPADERPALLETKLAADVLEEVAT